MQIECLLPSMAISETHFGEPIDTGDLVLPLDFPLPLFRGVVN